MKHILAENMRRFATKNLREATASMADKSSVPAGLTGRSVTMWDNKTQTGNSGIDISIIAIRRTGDKIGIMGLDLSDDATVDAYNAGKSVPALEFWFRRDGTGFYYTGLTFYNRWLVSELNQLYFK
jgi:hypothetical protein